MKTEPRLILDFIKQLTAHNNREWFNAHKDEYDQVKKAIERTAERLIALVATQDPRAALFTPAQCTYRIYRDTRFSPDKTPYKNHVGIFVNPPTGKKGETLGYYLHLQPGESFFAAGTGWSSPKVLKALRQGVYGEIEEYRQIVEADDFRSVYTQLGMDCLKTAPKGFPKEWPYIDYLKPRIFGASGPLSDALLNAPDWDARLLPFVEQGYLYNRFCNYFVCEALGIDD